MADGVGIHGRDNRAFAGATSFGLEPQQPHRKAEVVDARCPGPGLACVPAHCAPPWPSPSRCRCRCRLLSLSFVA
jgi:hypothetical protein